MAVNDDSNLFGTDILFNGGYPVTPHGDFTLVNKYENLRQSIFRRLMTNPGEYRLNPGYGCGMASFVKKPITNANLDTMKTRISNNLSRDPRIEKIETLTISHSIVNNIPTVKVEIAVRVKGNTVNFQPFTFSKQV